MKMKWMTGVAAMAAALACAPAALADETYDTPEFTGETAAAQWTPATTESCQAPELSPLLSGLKDNSLYFVAPGGDFEGSSAGWELQDGATVGAGSSAFEPLGSGDRSLRLPAGSVATSPAFCVDLNYPNFRVTVGQLGEKKAKVKVSVVYPGLAKNVRHAADLDVDAKQRWRLSKRVDLMPQYGQKKAGWRLVALRFEVDKADAGSDARVDDIVVDPKMRF